MKRTNLIILLAVSAFVVSTVPATAAEEPARGGFFIGFGVGGGTAGLGGDREGGGAGMFRVGYAPQDQLTLGLESAAWVSEIEGVNWTFNVSTFGVTYYPGNNGFYVKGGIGFAKVEAEVIIFDTRVAAKENGMGLLTALGYEARLTRKFALGGEATFAPIFLDDYDETNFVNVALTFNWYWSPNV